MVIYLFLFLSYRKDIITELKDGRQIVIQNELKTHDVDEFLDLMHNQSRQHNLTVGESGLQQNVDGETAVYCVNCGHRLISGSSFCSNCGNPLWGDVSSDKGSRQRDGSFVRRNGHTKEPSFVWGNSFDMLILKNLREITLVTA